MFGELINGLQQTDTLLCVLISRFSLTLIHNNLFCDLVFVENFVTTYLWSVVVRLFTATVMNNFSIRGLVNKCRSSYFFRNETGLLDEVEFLSWFWSIDTFIWLLYRKSWRIIFGCHWWYNYCNWRYNKLTLQW